MVPVTSGAVSEMRDAAFADLLEDINVKHRQPRLASVLSWLSIGFSLLCLFAIGPSAVLALLSIPVLWGVGAWLDAQRRVVPLLYAVDDAADAPYPRLCAAFDSLAGCQRMWHIQAGKVVGSLTEWKRQAGASHLVKRVSTAIDFALPPVLKCNLTPPMLKLGGRTFHFLPDVVLVRDGTGYGAVGYDSLRISHEISNFIETDPVPADALVTHHTWEHPNKNGGPDRRFRSNRRIPICRYETMHLTSASGINELLEFSKVGVVQPLVKAIAAVPSNRSLGEPKLLPGGEIDQPQYGTGSPRRGDFAIISGTAVALLFVFGLLASVMPHGSFGASAAPAPDAPAAMQATDQRMFVTSPQLNCRSSPAVTGDVEGRFARGASLHVVGLQGTWARVGSAEQGCWVNSRYLAARKPVVRPHVKGSSHAVPDLPSASEPYSVDETSSTVAPGDEQVVPPANEFE